MRVTSLPKPMKVQSGDICRVTSSKGRGQEVKVVSVNDRTVYYRPMSRGQDKSQTYKMPLPAFRNTHVMVRAVDDRLKRPPQAEESGPPAPAETPSAVSEAPPMFVRKLTDEQAKEIYLMAKAGVSSQRELARTYGVSETTVSHIISRRRYVNVTAALENEGEVDAATEPNEEEGDAPMGEIMQEEIEMAVQKMVTPTARVEGSSFVEVERQILVDLADALDTLVQYGGRPFPRYVSLDWQALEALSNRARDLAQ